MNPIFRNDESNANIITIKLSDSVIEVNVKPTEDNPRNSPEIPATLKLSATDKTAFSMKSNFPSGNRKLTRQYPGTKATNVNPKKKVNPDQKELLGIK